MTSLYERAVIIANEGQWQQLAALIESHPTLASEVGVDGRGLLITCAGLPGSEHVMKKLIDLGADPNRRALDGSNALAASIVGGSEHGLNTLPQLEFLLQVGADPEAVADSGMPALHWAIAQNRLNHARVLLKHGARPNQKTRDDPPESAGDVARRIGSQNALDLLGPFEKL